MIDENLPSKDICPSPVPYVIVPASSLCTFTTRQLTDSCPAFFLKNTSQSQQQPTIYQRHHGNDPEPAYSLRYLDPDAPTSQNRYGVALYDPYVTGVVYGEVAVIPEWTQPSLSADSIRANGGAAPPPEPILPTQFTIQLYNPDQQIVVRHKPKTWNTPARWEFEMPQNTFRVPSASTLDRTQSDPAAADITPKLRFSWRKDGKLSKDLSCLLHGKSSTIPDTRTKSREPDITVALFQGLRELTLYEPNMYRVEMEDFKGLEVALLLAAVAIRDIFFGPAKEAFHISASGPSPTSSKPPASAGATPMNSRPGNSPQPQKAPVASGAALSNGNPSPPRLSIPFAGTPAPEERRRQDERAKREEERRTQELLAAEEKSRRRREAEVEQETKRLQQIYGREEQQARAQRPNPASSLRPNLPPRHSGPSRPYGHQHTQSAVHLPPQKQQSPRPPHLSRPVPTFGNSPYLNPSAAVDPRAQSTAQLMQPRPQSTVGFSPQPTSTGALQPGSRPTAQVQPKKSSFFGFRRSKEESNATKLEKKRSSMF
ncbi:hypothetical protein NUU61_002743 [Penicillium alfredii]|uniref:Uncharacterized protein n=1 Tax=Penicillium alfredii TaxID=1506179 RepID=A0A9W9FS19_9EURO|nr:uncharacterized protein NUU61_002743 [Penicillium alfredii]KAJ5105396.1 hypothetical protein NUU61_002743 [Penicillium alfredii]